MSDGERTKSWLGWLAFITLLLIIGILLKIIPVIGVGISLIGFVILIVGGTKEDGEQIMWGVIFIIIGIVIFFIGIIAYNFIEDIGVINFLKLIFSLPK